MTFVAQPWLRFPYLHRGCFGLGGRDVSDGFEAAAVFEPVDLFEGCVFHGFEPAPWAAAVDNFGFEESIDRLGQGGGVTVTNAADRWFDACLGQPRGVFDGQIRRSTVRLVDQPHVLGRSAFVDRLIRGIPNEPGRRGCADTPANDPSGTGVDDRAMGTPLDHGTMERGT